MSGLTFTLRRDTTSPTLVSLPVALRSSFVALRSCLEYHPPDMNSRREELIRSFHTYGLCCSFEGLYCGDSAPQDDGGDINTLQAVLSGSDQIHSAYAVMLQS